MLLFPFFFVLFFILVILFVVTLVSSNFTTHRCKGRYGEIQKFTAASRGRYRIKAWGARAGEERTPATVETSQGRSREAKDRLKREYFHGLKEEYSILWLDRQEEIQ